MAGTVIQIKYSQYINFLGNSFLSAPILLIVVGVIVAFLGFFGCCGAIRENYCMTMTVSPPPSPSNCFAGTKWACSGGFLTLPHCSPRADKSRGWEGLGLGPRP